MILPKNAIKFAGAFFNPKEKNMMAKLTIIICVGVCVCVLV